MLITNLTGSDYWFGPMHLLPGGTLALDDTSDTSLYLINDVVADAVNTLYQSNLISVSGANTPFPRPTGVPALLHGDGAPQGKVYGGQGSLFARRDNTGGQTALSVKTTGVTFNTGWAEVCDPWSGLNQSFALQASVCPPALCNASLVAAAGIIHGCGVWLNAGSVITGLAANVTVVGASLSYAALGIYNYAYTLVASTSSTPSPFLNTGWAKVNLSSPTSSPPPACTTWPTCLPAPPRRRWPATSPRPASRGANWAANTPSGPALAARPLSRARSAHPQASPRSTGWPPTSRHTTVAIGAHGPGRRLKGATTYADHEPDRG